ncbi:GTP 3',8-cyclase MoaA [Desulfobacca acetoxidans]|uniref:GTP 3',8-cyclase n=1 Tax=Desulfobacca acetoxidans (strain ATCC 700848 / DSM 11109 / ASRB2) TaxID=880072 RepID=F2NC09_DESAR|nr:GTP 3',8-cyclase MoaA [Desulfobacca acetoxidans]AEB08086.1 molybdenum cofactor biosynthesis protein A [Desulfobacca acetoxidans DSM 11109]
MELSLRDECHRQITYLRLSITDRCNLRCFYCSPVQDLIKLPHADILRYEELLHLSRLSLRLGFNKIRVTGGEPLIRLGVENFLASLIQLPDSPEICLTTNGVLLAEKAAGLWQSGLRRLNISLDSLQRQRFARITGSDLLSRVWEGIQTVQALGFSPIKINCVVLRGLNDDEILDFARLSLEYPWHIRFIEFMPIGQLSRWRQDYYVSADDMRLQLLQLGQLEEIPSEANAGPAQRFRYPGAPGEIGLISPLSHHFCHLCNRLRLTADGRLRPCLLGDAEIDLKAPLRAGADDDTLQELIRQAVRIKPVQHHMDRDFLTPCRRSMTSIGG